jgi:heme exporter protein A
MLEVKNLYFDYADKQVLRDVNFSVDAGCLLHVRGKNGVGKSTLLKLLVGLLQPDSGAIYYEGQSIDNDRLYFQRSCCYVGHKLGISQSLTVRENCLFDVKSAGKEEVLPEVMRQFSLQGLDDVPCSVLSAGQKRRVGLMRTVLSGASLWVLDEPLVALDHDTVLMLMNCFIRHLEEGGHIIITSHQSLPLPGTVGQDYWI